MQLARAAEFGAFATERLELTPSGRTHETEVVRSFRSFFAKYRSPDMSRTADGVSLADAEIVTLLREWGRARIERTPAGYWKGVACVDTARAAAAG